MNQMMTQITIGEVAAGVGLVSAVVGFFAKVMPLLRRTGHFLDDWFGEEARDGQPARPGVTARLTQIEAEQSRVRREVEHNGGGSLKDAVRRVEREQATQAAALATLNQLLGAFAAKEQSARKSGHEASQAAWNAVEQVARDDQS